MSGVLVSLPKRRVVESRARSVSPRVGSGPTNASIAKGEEKNAAHLDLLQDDTEHEMHQRSVTVLHLLTKASVELLRRPKMKHPWPAEGLHAIS